MFMYSKKCVHFKKVSAYEKSLHISKEFTNLENFMGYTDLKKFKNLRENFTNMKNKVREMEKSS